MARPHAQVARASASAGTGSSALGARLRNEEAAAVAALRASAASWCWMFRSRLVSSSHRSVAVWEGTQFPASSTLPSLAGARYSKAASGLLLMAVSTPVRGSEVPAWPLMKCMVGGIIEFGSRLSSLPARPIRKSVS